MAKANHGAAARRWSRAALGASFGAVVVSIAGFGGIDSRVWGPVACGLFLFSAGLVLAACVRGQGLPWEPVLAPALAFGGLIALQWRLGWSVYPGATLTGLVQLAACGCVLYLALFAFQRRSNIRWAGTALWILAGVLSGEAIAQYFTAFRYVYWYRPALYATPIGPFIYHNHFAGCMDLLLPIAVVVAFRPLGAGAPGRLDQLRRGMVPALCLIAVVMSQSRGGLLALVAEGLAAVALGWRELAASRQLRRGVVLAALLLSAFAALANWGPMIHRMSYLGRQDVSVMAREQVALSCVAIWRDHAWIGSGFNTFATVYPQYQRFDDGKQYLVAHDEYAQTLAETGVVGGICVLAFIGMFVVACRRSWNTKSAGGIILYKQAAFVACLGFLFHSAIDFQFHAFANALLFFLLAGLGAARLRLVPKPETNRAAGSAGRGAEATLAAGI